MSKAKFLIGLLILGLVSIVFAACTIPTQPQVSNQWVWVGKHGKS